MQCKYAASIYAFVWKRREWDTPRDGVIVDHVVSPIVARLGQWGPTLHGPGAFINGAGRGVRACGGGALLSVRSEVIVEPSAPESQPFHGCTSQSREIRSISRFRDRAEKVNQPRRRPIGQDRVTVAIYRYISSH
jgi:hypothetical protein